MIPAHITGTNSPSIPPPAAVPWRSASNDNWTSENVTVTISGGFITATVPRPVSGKCFLRWKISLL